MRPDIGRYARLHQPAPDRTRRGARRLHLTRRAFLESTAASAAFVLSFHFAGMAEAQEEGAPPGEKKPVNPFDAWVKIAADGTVTLTLAKTEMGQGAMTALPMILAEELDVDFARVKVEQALCNPNVYAHGTGGSASVKESYLPLRQAGAVARAMLVGAAADRLKVDPSSLRTDQGVVVGPGGQRVGYGELVAEAAKRTLPDFKTVPLKDEKTFRIVGTNPPRLDIPSKVDGSAQYGLDVRVPGMLYAVIARCPTFGGKALRFDAAKAKAVPGVREVVEIRPTGPDGAFAPGGVAVVAESTWAAIQGREALGIEWDPGPNKEESTAALRSRMERLLAAPGKLCRNDGDCESVLAKAAKKIEAVYELPFVAHACMEPLNATVHVKPEGIEAWLPTQTSDWNLGVMATVAGMKPEQVKVHTTLLGGGFGRKAHSDYAAEGAQVSQAVKAPVQIVWTREDDIQHGFYRPMSMHRLAGAVDDAGNLAAWQHRMTSTSIDAFWSPPDKAKPESSEIGGAVNLAYAIPNIRMDYALARTAVPVMWWRSVEHSNTAFANECFFDELAHLAGQDPLKLRLALLAEPRMVKFPEDTSSILDTRRLKGVLELAAEKAGWGRPLPSGRGRGIACHFSFDSYAAEVAEVSVEEGRIRVHRIVAAVDCGRVVHPDGVTAQVEGAIVYGLSAALKGAITIKDGRCEQSNFDDFEVLRLPEMPQVEVHLVKSDAPPTGIGEPGLPPAAPAVMNAVFAATGKRLRRLPVRPADLA
jgi:isoquinoline 1-oxidoreductase beta subunit